MSRARLLFMPLLWLRKQIFRLLILLVGLALIVYFITNSPLVIQKVAERFAPDYNITYSRIHGNFITGVKIEDLRYQDQKLAQNFAFKWNPTALLKKEIQITKAKITQANIEHIKVWIDSFSTEENSTATEPFSFAVSVKNIDVELLPFEEYNVSFSFVGLKVKELYYESESVEVTSLKLRVDSNISQLDLSASLKDGNLKIKDLTLDKFDTIALQTLLSSDRNESDSKASLSESNSTQGNEANPLIPHYITIKKADINLLPRTFVPFDINRMHLTLLEGGYDIKTTTLQEGKVSINADSNLSALNYEAKVHHNSLNGRAVLLPKKALFDHYNLPLNASSIREIPVDLEISKEKIVASLDTKVKQIMDGEYPIDIDDLHAKVEYDLNNSLLKADTKAMLSTPYAKEITVTNHLVLDKTIRYDGEISASELREIDEKLSRSLEHLQMVYQGNEANLTSKIDAENLTGTFVVDGFKTANLHIENKNTIQLNQWVTLPSDLNQSEADITIDLPLDFESNASIHGYAKINSNVVDLDADISYMDNLKVNSLVEIPKDSLLKSYSEAVKWDNISPLNVDVIWLEGKMETLLKTSVLNAHGYYDLTSNALDANVSIGATRATCSGIIDKKLALDMQVHEIASFMKDMATIYTFEELPDVRGKANVSVKVSDMQTLDLSLKSPDVTYVSDNKQEQTLDDIEANIHITPTEVLLNQYTLTYQKQKIFSNKPSKVDIKENVVSIAPLWINDTMKVDGNYSLETKQGAITADAKNFHVSHEIIDLDSTVDLKAVLDGNKTSIEGDVLLLGGNIHYDMNQKTFASDSDIIILQELKKKKPSVFMDNLSTDIHIQSKDPLVYKKKNIDIAANVDVSIHKAEGTELMLLGSVELLKGGSYIFKNKKFVLDKSFVHFTGNPNNPLLEVTVKYKGVNHIISILITGSADMPNITFSSQPSLTKEQILSVILFDSEGAAGTNSGADMMKMMGGAMAKSALNDLGVKLDHLVLGEGNSVEVGKKLTNKITIIYVNDIVSSVKLKYEHSKHTESVISAGEESQSYDIIYKTDF